MVRAKRSEKKASDNSDINPIDDPKGAIDFYMPLPDEIYRKWKKRG